MEISDNRCSYLIQLVISLFYDRRFQVLANAANIVEEYFVTPPGNISLEKAPKLDWSNLWDDAGTVPMVTHYSNF